MSDLYRKFPVLDIVGRSWESASKVIERFLRIWQNDVVTAVNSKQDKDAELNIKYYNQADEPTLSTNENAAFWEDSDAGPKYYLILKTSSGSQVKVELV